MKIAGDAAFCVDVAKDAFDLLGRKAKFGRNFSGGIAVGFSIQHEVHRLIRQAEIKFFLSLRQGISVGCGRPVQDYFRNAKILSQLIDLRLVQVSDGF